MSLPPVPSAPADDAPQESLRSTLRTTCIRKARAVACCFLVPPTRMSLVRLDRQKYEHASGSAVPLLHCHVIVSSSRKPEGGGKHGTFRIQGGVVRCCHGTGPLQRVIRRVCVEGGAVGSRWRGQARPCCPRSPRPVGRPVGRSGRAPVRTRCSLAGSPALRNCNVPATGREEGQGHGVGCRAACVR